MKKMKFTICMAALVSAFVFSSCLNDNDGSDYPNYQVAVTVGSGGLYLYADNGSILQPVSIVEGLSQLERAVVAFDLASEEQNGIDLESGKTYNVVIEPYYSYSIPTSNVIDLYHNEVAADSLVNTQDAVNSVQGLYAVNGYVNAYISLPYNSDTTPYVDVAYNSEEDIDVENGKLYLTLYYDDGSEYSNSNISNQMFSFKLPMEAYSKLGAADTDKIELVFRYKSNNYGGENQTATYEMAKEDLWFRGY